jgi:hypothetical protein
MAARKSMLILTMPANPEINEPLTSPAAISAMNWTGFSLRLFQKNYMTNKKGLFHTKNGMK